MQFEEVKRRILNKYQIALDKNLVDISMIPINDKINQLPNVVTTSTCYGRVIVISKSEIRSKYNTTFHFKSHQPEDISKWKLENLKYNGELWFLLEAPNLHIRCENFEIAKNIHQLALQSKLSKSKYQSIDPNIIVEILGTSSLQVPLGSDGDIFLKDNAWNLLKQKATELLEVEQLRLEDFGNCFS